MGITKVGDATKGELDMAEQTEPITDHVEESDTALELLEAGIPLTLLLDLAMPIHSTDTYKTEPGAADWLDADVHVA
jgi:hypothetical protein